MSSTAVDEANPLTRILRAADTDVDAFFDLFTEDALFRLGNNQLLRGIDEIKAWVGEYLGSVASIAHDIREQWTVGDTSIVRLDVTYGMANGAGFTLPAAVYGKSRDGKIAEYLIFMDPSPVVEAS